MDSLRHVSSHRISGETEGKKNPRELFVGWLLCQSNRFTAVSIPSAVTSLSDQRSDLASDETGTEPHPENDPGRHSMSLDSGDVPELLLQSPVGPR